MTETQPESHTAATKRILAELAGRWPALFNADRPVPLAVGIHAALVEAMPGVTEEQIRRVLTYWCRRPRYLAALKHGAERHGLAGVQGGLVAEDEAEAAAAVLAECTARLNRRLYNRQQMEKGAREAAKRREEQAKAKEEAEAKKLAEEAEARKAKPPAPPKPAMSKSQPASAKAKPTAAPAIIVKKRRFPQPGSDTPN